MAEVPQPVNDNTLTVRQLTHYQFSYVPGEAGADGTFTLQLVLDQGAWEEVITVPSEDGIKRRRPVVLYALVIDGDPQSAAELLHATG